VTWYLPNIISWCQQVFSLYKPDSLYSLPSHWKSALIQATLKPRTESVRPKEHKKNKQTKAGSLSGGYENDRQRLRTGSPQHFPHHRGGFSSDSRKTLSHKIFFVFFWFRQQVDGGGCFNGAGNSALVLKGVNLTVHSGEVMAILGSKGITKYYIYLSQIIIIIIEF